MPNTYASAKAAGRQNQSSIDIRGGVTGITIFPGSSCDKSANDCFYIREASNVLIDGFKANNPVRNGGSVTGQVNNITIQDCDLGGAQNFSGSQIADGLDIEPNSPADFVLGLHILNNNFHDNQEYGLKLSDWFLNDNSQGGVVKQPFTVEIRGNQAFNNTRGGYTVTGGKDGFVPLALAGSGNTENGKAVSFPN
jgi:hypothetical protein